MNKFLSILSILICLSVISCDNASQNQHNIFPIPCIDKNGHPYYIDENGHRLDDLEESLKELGANKNWLPDFFKDGVIKVDLNRNGSRICLFLDEDGETVLDVYNTVFRNLFPKEYDKALCTDFSEGIAFVTSDTTAFHSYAINKEGEVVFELNGNPVTGFNHRGRAFFKNSQGYYGVIATNGQVVMEPRESIVINRYNLPPRRGMVNYKTDGRYGLMSFNGQSTTGGISDNPMILDRNRCVVFYDKENDKYGIATKHGEILCITDYKDLRNDGKWYYFETKDNKIGWCDKNGKVVIPPIEKAGNQMANSKCFDLPRPFFGSKLSVVTLTTKGANGYPEYLSAGLLPKNMKSMKGTLSIKNTVHPTESGIAISPIVNRRIMILDMLNRANLYLFKKGGVYKISKTPFEPRFGYEDFNTYGRFAIYPSSVWKGF